MLDEETGFTLVELLAAVSVLGILVAAVAIHLGALVPQFALDNAAQEVAMVLNQGRVQAITRGHTMVVMFGATDLTITDEVTDETVATNQLPSHISISADGDVTFTPLGTVTAPVTVTVSDSHSSREVNVGLIGEVQIQ